MNKKRRVWVLLALLCVCGPTVSAEETQKAGGHIGFTGTLPDSGIRDPEHPENRVDPGESPSTTGPLRIDFVPQLDFSRNKMSEKTVAYPVQAQLFKDNTAARGNFIQITDTRSEALGWTLHLRQESQFENKNSPNKELKGAVLSFNHSWVNSTTDRSLAPTVSKEVIHLDQIGDTYNLAKAEVGKGSGIWSISFGASTENPMTMPPTLRPKTDATGNAVLDARFGNKQVMENEAITLSVPGKTKKDPVSYTTVLTWLLAELP